MILLSLELALLNAWLFFKNPLAYIQERRKKAEFESGLDALERVVKNKALNQHYLKLKMNAFYQRKKRSGNLNEFQLLRLVQKKFKTQIEAAGVKTLRVKKGAIQLR